MYRIKERGIVFDNNLPPRGMSLRVFIGIIIAFFQIDGV